MTENELKRQYNALRQKFEEASGSCGEHRCCTELDELKNEFLALPELTTTDVPEVKPDTSRRYNGRLVTDEGYVLCTNCNCYDYTDCAGAEYRAELDLTLTQAPEAGE